MQPSFCSLDGATEIYFDNFSVSQKCNLMAAKTESDGKRKARNIDKLSRQCFPLAFILFNVVYWTVYTFPSSDSVDVDGA